jgi:hypothetical protein
MPYIADEQRALLNPHIDALLKEIFRLPEANRGGAFDYIIFTMLRRLTYDEKYQVQRGYVGDLIWALMEWYRRFAGPYEDKARHRNGDIL